MALLIDFTGAATVHSGATFANSNVTDIGTPYHSPGGVWSIAKVRLDTANVPGTKTSTDVYQMIAVPAYTWCLGCWFNVKAGRMYPAADTIDVLVGTAAFTSSNGVYDIYALLMSYNVPF